ncbi:hypothetical protein [Rhodococcus pyridinivorans]|uniref:hypothetical protein n=1 Tax=Rhodococcus pyridinivorans TaxID=103816 RepID=UPI003AB10736
MIADDQFDVFDIDTDEPVPYLSEVCTQDVAEELSRMSGATAASDQEEGEEHE